MRVAGGEYARDVGTVLEISCDTASRIKLNREIRQQSALYGSGETHRQEDEIGLELEIGSGHPRKIGASVGEDFALHTCGVKALNTTVLAGERRGRDAPLAIASLLVRV